MCTCKKSIMDEAPLLLHGIKVIIEIDHKIKVTKVKMVLGPF